ncbi:hypothetical protein E2C01_086023 [Portunus trituberculatus]|uniref:Uncharacterized protein n=1 Tax=Portunus trituberculatus TaxID=210409 RepID=A0A5B7J8J7_PORTR|nr:hypothetical protein [Portunus trituberculatus]
MIASQHAARNNTVRFLNLTCPPCLSSSSRLPVKPCVRAWDAACVRCCPLKRQVNISVGDGRLRCDSRLSRQLVACILDSELTLCNYKVGYSSTTDPTGLRGRVAPTPTLLVVEL